MQHYLKTSFIYYSAGFHAKILNDLSFSSKDGQNSHEDKCTAC